MRMKHVRPTRQSSGRLPVTVILDFNRKSSDHIESVSSLFVGGSIKMGLGSAGFQKKVEYFLKSLFLKILLPYKLSSHNFHNLFLVFQIFLRSELCAMFGR